MMAIRLPVSAVAIAKRAIKGTILMGATGPKQISWIGRGRADGIRIVS
ncbi:MAG: hypothetical protein ABID63_13020 [Pseudomonadota bacterium]